VYIELKEKGKTLQYISCGIGLDRKTPGGVGDSGGSNRKVTAMLPESGCLGTNSVNSFLPLRGNKYGKYFNVLRGVKPNILTPKRYVYMESHPEGRVFHHPVIHQNHFHGHTSLQFSDLDKG